MQAKNKRKILILGACGSIGSKILEKFLENEKKSNYIACYKKKNPIYIIKKKFKENIDKERPLSARENIHEAVNNMMSELAKTEVDYQNEANKENIISKITKDKNKTINKIVTTAVAENINQLTNQAKLDQALEEKPVALTKKAVNEIVQSNVQTLTPVKIKLPRITLKKKRSVKKVSKRKLSTRSSKKISKRKSSRCKISKRKSSKSKFLEGINCGFFEIQRRKSRQTRV
jgi:hypothetical protein